MILFKSLKMKMTLTMLAIWMVLTSPLKYSIISSQIKERELLLHEAQRAYLLSLQQNDKEKC